MSLITCILIAIPVCLLGILLWTYYDYRKFKRRNSLIILLLLLSPMALHAQYKDKENCTVSFKWLQNQKGKLEYTKNKLVYEFIPSAEAWKIVIRNTSTDDAQVNWNNAEFIINGKASGMILHPFTDAKAPVETIKGNNETSQSVTAANLVIKGKTGKIYTLKDLKKGGRRSVTIVLPVAIGNSPQFFNTFDFIIAGAN